MSPELPHDESLHCVCNDSFSVTQPVISLDMLSDIAQNLSALAVPTLNSLVKYLYDNQTVEEALVNTSTTESSLADNFTYYYENSSLYWYDNTSSSSNLTEPLSIDDIKDFFVDYLTFVLSPFMVANNSNDSLVTENNNNSYELFKTTLLPLFNNTIPQEELRFETELTTLFEEISTTLSSLTEEFSSSELSSTEITITTTTTTDTTEYNYCQNYCKNIQDFQMSTSTSTSTTAITTVSYGEVEYRKILNYTMNAKLRSLCWETMFGQELLKLTVMDLIVTGLSILMMDFFR